MKDRFDTIKKEIPERYLKIGGVQGVTYLYLLSECCVPLEQGGDEDKVIPFTRFESIPVFIGELKDIARQLFSDSPDISSLSRRTETLRLQIRDFATDVYAYLDILKLYEYVMVRTKPVDVEASRQFNDEAEAREILSAIFRSGSNAAINENISAVTAQLPLRMTKARYRDILMTELKVYADGPKSAFERNMFLIRMSAGVSGYPRGRLTRIEECIDSIKSADLKNIGSEEKTRLDNEIYSSKIYF